MGLPYPYGEVENTAPASEPITTANAKTHLRVTSSADDTYIDGLVVAARKYVEGVRGESLINTTWEHYLERFPGERYIELPRRPLSSVTSVAYRKEGEATYTTWSSDNYLAETTYAKGRVALKYSLTWPTDTLESGHSVKIIYVAGYGATAASVPAPLIQAMKLLIGHWYENRSELAGASNLPRTIEMAARRLINFDRIRSI